MQLNFGDQNDEKLSRSIEGSLSLMPLSDVIQWIEISRRTGTLIANNDIVVKRFFFQNGRLIFIWSEQEGERICDALKDQFSLQPERIMEDLRNAEQLGISCIGYISSEEGIPIEQLNSMISSLAEKSLSDALTWKAGRFRFSDFLPATVLSSPVNLTTSQVLFDSAVMFDENRLESKASVDPVLDEIFDLIRKGAVDIPPIPAEMQQLMEQINNPDLSVDDIIETICDPLLVSKILKICNSPFYGRRGKVSTMREAVVYMGLKSLMSIVTVHALSEFSPKNIEQVQKILHHSMMVGMIAKQISRDLQGNHDQAFVCGLLHDLGWIVMLEMLSGYDIHPDKRLQLIRHHHAAIGCLVAKKWHFSDEIQDVTRYHHEPALSINHHQIVEIIHLSDMLAKNEAPPPDSEIPLLSNTAANFTTPFTDRLEELDKEIESILAPL
jgi:putative nucleotidyltransferase with HDIG domain